jgi:hypothetical protein
MAKTYWMNVVVKRGSLAEAKHRRQTNAKMGAIAEPGALADGIPQTPDHDLVFHGGKTIPNLTYTNFYVGGKEAWDATDVRNIDAALAAIMSDNQLNNVIVQYFPDGRITTTFRPSSFLPGPPPRTVSRGDVEALLNAARVRGDLQGVDAASTVFNFMLPKGTVLTTDDAPSDGAQRATASKTGAYGRPQGELALAGPDEQDTASSLEGLGGYHGSIQAAGQTFYYAVGVYSHKLEDGSENGIDAFGVSWKNIVATFYHELCEVRTDPDVEEGNKTGDESLIGWTSPQGEECGDLPIFEDPGLSRVFREIELADKSGTAPLQFQYSNMVHGPEGPIAKPH